jgi:hypothetical protein
MISAQIKLFFILLKFWKIINYLCPIFYKIKNLQISTMMFEPQTYLQGQELKIKIT